MRIFPRRGIWHFTLAVFFLLPVFPRCLEAAVEINLPVPVVETLANGLRVVWFVGDSLPVIDLQLIVNSGDRDDPPGKTGVASLLAETIERGAAGMNANQIAHSIEDLGASRAITAEEDGFSIAMHGLAPDGPVLLEMLGKLALHPDFPPQEVKREQARLLDRWNHLSDYGDSLASLLLQRAMESGTTYARGGFLSPEEFKRINRQDVIAFYKKNFTPRNSILLVVGRVKKAEFQTRIEKIFGAWTGEAPVRRYITYRNDVGKLARSPREVLIVDRPDLNQAQVRMGFRAPLIQDSRHYALSLANAMLGEYFNSRLNALIRDQLGLTYGIGSAFSYDKDFASFTIDSATATETIGKLVTKTIDVLRDFKKGPIPPAEVKMAQDYLTGSFPLRTATLGAVAAGWVNAYLLGLPSDYLNQFVPRINAVTPEQVLKAVKSTFDLDALTIVAAGDAEGIERSLKEAGIRSRRVPVKLLISGSSGH